MKEASWYERMGRIIFEETCKKVCIGNKKVLHLHSLWGWTERFGNRGERNKK